MTKLWSEKHIPKSISEFHNDLTVTDKLKNYLEKNTIYNLILVGNAGSGKTAIIDTFLKQLYQENYTDFILRLNFVDDYSLKSLNDILKNFAYMRTKNAISLPKVLYFDGLDDILQHKNQYKYQQIISTVIDLLQNKNICFVLTCRDHNNIIEGIQSKAIIIRLNKPSNVTITDILKHICEKEKINYQMSALEILSDWVNGDIRCAINYLQMMAQVYQEISVVNSNLICASNYMRNIDELLNLCIKQDFKNALIKLRELMEDGNMGEDICKKMLDVVMKKEMDAKIKFHFIDYISKLCIAISQGGIPIIQLSGCIAKLCSYSIK